MMTERDATDVPMATDATEERDTTPPTVRVAKAEERRAAIDTIMLSFATDLIVRWFFLEPADYVHDFPEFIEIYGGDAFEHGSAHYIEGFAASALWLPPDVRPDEDALLELFGSKVPETRQEATFTALEALDVYHPAEPFWHLPFIGTDPMNMRNGYGSALLRHGLEICDREGSVAYLESTNPANLSLYVRHGFEVLGTIQEGRMPPLFPMVRKPQQG
jgi:ribosomal protein S18 acetylase RimI-like enzyme